MTVKSKKAFYEVINKYPDSEFVEDAYLKIDIINDRLAAKEIEIARYYQFKQQWISAINRYNKILEDYDTSVYTEEALHRLVEIYYSLGLIEEAKRYASTLGFNFPDEIKKTKYEKECRDLVIKSKNLYEKLSKDYPQLKDYTLLFGHNIRYSITLNVRQAFHLIELRTAKQGHISYRRVCMKMHDQIRDIAKHENFYNLMNYTDHEEYELQRLDSEVKQAKKENLTNS